MIDKIYSLSSANGLSDAVMVLERGPYDWGPPNLRYRAWTTRRPLLISGHKLYFDLVNERADFAAFIDTVRIELGNGRKYEWVYSLAIEPNDNYEISWESSEEGPTSLKYEVIRGDHIDTGSIGGITRRD